jgi:hypothetical protein
MTDELDRTIRHLRSVDLIDPGAWDDAFFDGLADAVMNRIEAGSTPSRILELPPRRRPPRWWGAAAALAALLLGAVLWSQGPADPPVEEPSLTALGSEIGREVIAELAAEPTPADARLALSWTVEDLLSDAGEDAVYTTWSLADELDELSAAELHSVLARL